MFIHFISGLENGGTQSYLFRIIKYKLENKDHIIMYLKDGVTKKKFQELNNVIGVYSIFNALRIILFFNKYEQAHFWLYHTYIIRLFVRSKKYIAHIRGTATPENNLFSNFNKFFFKIAKFSLNNLRFDTIISNSISAIYTYKSYGFLLKKYKIVYNDILVQKSFCFVFPNRDLNILNITRNDPAKNNNRFKMLVKELDSHMKFKVNIIGEGMLSFYKKNPLNIINEIHISDTIPFEKLIKVYQETDIVIITSTNEGLPNVLLEALNYGIPVIASDAGDCQEVLSKNPFYQSKINNIDNHRFNIIESMNTIKTKNYGLNWSRGCDECTTYVQHNSNLFF